MKNFLVCFSLSYGHGHFEPLVSMVEEQSFQVSSTSHTSQLRLQRLLVALGGGMGSQLSSFMPIAEAKPGLDTCAYPATGRGWSANTHTA